MDEHLRLAQQNQIANRKNIHYLSSDIQNDVIAALAGAIRSSIMQQIKESKFYSVIADCTPDISHTEQLSLTIRYVRYVEESNEFNIFERFITFNAVTSKTGQGIADLLIEMLTNIGLNIDDMLGQGYDNGSNMKGKNIGVQKIILDKNPLAAFVPCACHSLNLVLNDLNDFSTVQEVYNRNGQI